MQARIRGAIVAPLLPIPRADGVLLARQRRKMTPDRPAVQQLTRRLIDREAPGDAPAKRAAAVHSACERVAHELSRWVGTHGCDVLFTRALTESRTEHPLLATIRVRGPLEPGLDGVPESIQANGAAETAAALEALLVTLFELLGRLIGDDMVMRLLGRGVQENPQADETIQARRKAR